MKIGISLKIGIIPGISLSEVGVTNFGHRLCFLLQELPIGTGFQRRNPYQWPSQKAKRKELVVPATEKKSPKIQMPRIYYSDIARYL